MNRKVLLILVCILLVFSLHAKKANIKFYGNIESTFDVMHKKVFPNFFDDSQKDVTDDDNKAFSWGWNNFANLRLKGKAGDYITFGMAFNINLFTGNYAEIYGLMVNNLLINGIGQGFFSIPFSYQATYIGFLELERLYFKGGNDYFDIETGLIRLARGYGYSFSPMDFFNPRDPTDLNVRPNGKLAFVTTFYPMAMWKIELFAVAPDNPVEHGGWGFKFGTATLFNVDSFNFEFLYSFFLPEIELGTDPEKLGLPEYTMNNFSHIAGFSFKADVEVGLYVEAIYRFDHRSLETGYYHGKPYYFYRGLEASLGIDYSFEIPNTNVSLYLLLEYEFYGSGLLDWGESIYEMYIYDDWDELDPLTRYAFYDSDKPKLSMLRHNYLFGMIDVTLNTYVTLGANYLFGIDDQSSMLGLHVDIELFQEFTINISASYPFGWDTMNSEWEPGEFGPTNSGMYQDYKVTAKLKF